MKTERCLTASFFAIFICKIFAIQASEDTLENIFDENKLIPVTDVENNVDFNSNDSGDELCEGDMVCDKKTFEGGSDRNAITGEKFRWGKENGIVTVPYVFDSSLKDSTKKQVLAVAADYAGWTCIKFVERTDQADYIRFHKGGGCWSKIGKQGGKQDLSLGENCDLDKGTPAHEMMHSLGFNHEQGRHDRDQYIEIVKENITPTKEFNFDICAYCTDPEGMPYDYRSVMHYGATAFSKNGEATMIPKSGDPKLLGQRGGLCTGDIKKLNHMYKCGGITAAPTKPNNGVVPCDQPYDRWTNCASYLKACSDPRDDYKLLRMCPVTCFGKEKGGLYDRYSICSEEANKPDKDNCSTWPAIRDHCTLSCAERKGASGSK